MAPFAGVGTWVDVFDWAPSATNGRPVVGPSAVHEMAAAGVQTLYLQTARTGGPADLIDERLLRRWIDAAHAEGLDVVGWYLPEHRDEAKDLRRLVAIASLGVDGIGVDIEGTSVTDVAERSRRLMRLSRGLRAQVGDLPLGAIVFSPLALEWLKPGVWPHFPWAELGSVFDVWLPMGYWTFRRGETPEWDDGARYTKENFRILKEVTGQSNPLIHTIGGLAGDVRSGQVDGMVDAVSAEGGIGASLYGWPETSAASLRSLERIRRVS